MFEDLSLFVLAKICESPIMTMVVGGIHKKKHILFSISPVFS